VKRAHSPRRLAFSLIELLDTIAIFAILAAIWIPALAGAQEAARRAACANNNQQLAIASGMYSGDNRNRIASFNNWLFKPASEGANYNSTNYGDFSTGRIYPYFQTKKSYMCPTDLIAMRRPTPYLPRVDRAMGYGPPRIRQNSYVMNCQSCHYNDLSTWRTPSQTVLFHEANLATNDCSGIGGPKSGVPIPVPGGMTQVLPLPFRHSKTAFIIAGDSSVQRIKYKTILSLTNWGDGINVATDSFWNPGSVSISSTPLE
jgi:prepilin-type N-terminal cleavage/methylation domain-containing protein